MSKKLDWNFSFQVCLSGKGYLATAFVKTTLYKGQKNILDKVVEEVQK